MRRLPLLFVVALTACVPSASEDGGQVDLGDADTDTDTDADTDTDSAFPLSSDDEIRAAWTVVGTSAYAPLGAFFLAAFGAESGCPVVEEETDTQVVFRGGCTTDDGVAIEGGLTVFSAGDAGATLTFAAFSYDIEGTLVLLDGDASIAADGGLVTAEQLDVTVTGVPDSVAMIDGARVRYTNLEQAIDAQGAGLEDVPMRGAAAVSGLGALAWSGTVSYGTDECSGDVVSGTVTLSGTREVALGFEEVCARACLTWSSGGDTGEICDAE